MTTYPFIDALGNTQTGTIPPVPGPALMVASNPMVLASDHSPIVVGGMTAIAIVSIQRPADTVAYSIGDNVASSTSGTAVNAAPSSIVVARKNGGTGSIRRVRVSRNSTNGTGTDVMRVHFLRTAPTVANGDNGALSYNGVGAIHIGYADVTLDRVFADGAKGIGVPAVGAEISFDCAAGSTSLFILLEARSAIAPASGETFTIACEIFQDA